MYKLSPSKAHRFLHCTKSLEFDVAFIETPQTVRGNVLHKLAEMSLRNEEVLPYIQEHKINEYEIYLINGYSKEIWEELSRIPNSEMVIEEKRPIIIYNNNINLIIDCLILGDKIASIFDLKTGNGEVEVEDNEQLYFYAYMVATKYDKIETFILNIYQKGKKKTTQLTRQEVLDFFLEREDTFREIESGRLQYRPSNKACKFCPIKETCMARAKWIIGGKK
jgi:CRISPR/Cas system-associated exonuclease Cas4 (RecB family)